jgi:alkylation response protein AidB-like acyl-CoA dehydrogenase
MAGGLGIFKQTGLERFFRDARIERIPPASAFLTHEFAVKITLGINPR